MSKSAASESKDDCDTPETSRKRGGEDEGDEDGEEIVEGTAVDNSTTLTTVSAAPAATDQFIHTPEFRRHFVEFIHVQTLMALRVVTKGWNVAADALIDEGVASGVMMVHDGKDISWKVVRPRLERRKLLTRVIFLLNITQVGGLACL